MRILIANWSRALAGGAERYLRTLIPALSARGHDVALWYETEAPAGHPTIDDPEWELPTFCVARSGGAQAIRDAEDWKPDVAYLHGLLSPDLESALVERFPSALFAHGYYGTCGTGHKRHAFPARRMCQRQLGVMCLVLHYPRRCGGTDPVAALRTYRSQQRRNSLLSRYQAVLVASRWMRGEYGRHSVSSDRLHLAPLPPAGVRPDPDPPGPRTPAAAESVVLFLGRHTPDKGVDYLIRALPIASAGLGRQLRLVTAGTGPDPERLRGLAARLGLSAEFRGWVDDEERLELMRDADLLAVPSVWPEPFGLVGIEAGCVGLPAVGYAVGGIPDWLVPGESGESASGDPPTVHGLAEAMVRALANPAHYSGLRVGAWRVARRFTMDAHLAVLEPALEGIARRAVRA